MQIGSFRLSATNRAGNQRRQAGVEGAGVFGGDIENLAVAAENRHFRVAINVFDTIRASFAGEVGFEG